MIGPETTNSESAAAALDGSGELAVAAGSGAALEAITGWGLSPPQLASCIAKITITPESNLRMVSIRAIVTILASRTILNKPRSRPAQKHVACRPPGNTNLSTPFHPRSNGSIRIGNGNAGIERGRSLNARSFWTDD